MTNKRIQIFLYNQSISNIKHILDSLACQTYKNFSVVVQDNGKKDLSFDFCRMFSRKNTIDIKCVTDSVANHIDKLANLYIKLTCEKIDIGNPNLLYVIAQKCSDIGESELVSWNLNTMNYVDSKYSVNRNIDISKSYSILFNKTENIQSKISATEKKIDYILKNSTKQYVQAPIKKQESSNKMLEGFLCDEMQQPSKRQITKKTNIPIKQNNNIVSSVEQIRNRLGKSKIIVAMTSWLKRINNCPVIIKNLLTGSLVPDLLFLNLSVEEFPNKEKDLPVNLINMAKQNKNFIINWIDGPNTKSFKKVFPVLQNIELDDIIIPIDDDILYPTDYIQSRMIDFIKYEMKNPLTGSLKLAGSTLERKYGIPLIFGSSGIFTKRMLNNYDIFINNDIIQSFNDDSVYTLLSWLNGFVGKFVSKYDVCTLVNRHTYNEVIRGGATGLYYTKDKLIQTLNKRLFEVTGSNDIKKIFNFYNDIHAKKIVIYSFCCGDIKKFPNITFKNKNIDWVMFTDNKNINSNGWEIRTDIPCSYTTIWDKNKYVKWNAFKYFKDKYDYSLYIDAKVELNEDPIDILNSAIKRISDNVGFSTYKHFLRKCIYKESAECIKVKRGNVENIKKLIQRYKAEKFPENYGLPETVCVLTNLKSKNALNLQEQIFSNYFESNTYRDQLTVSYIMWKNKIRMDELTTFGKNQNDFGYIIHKGKTLKLVEKNVFTRPSSTKYNQPTNKLKVGILQAPQIFENVKTMLLEKYSNDPKFNDTVIILGLNTVNILKYSIEKIQNDFKSKKVILYQLEQISNLDNNYFNPNSSNGILRLKSKKLISCWNNCFEIWDYDINNAEQIKKFIKNPAKVKVNPMPLDVNALKRKSNTQNKDIDILFYGALNDHRKNILQQIDKKYNLIAITNQKIQGIKCILPTYGNNLIKYIDRSKIILNIHFYSASIQEQVRLFDLIINNKIILSEKSKTNYFGDKIIEFDSKSNINSIIDSILKKYKDNNYNLTKD